MFNDWGGDEKLDVALEVTTLREHRYHVAQEGADDRYVWFEDKGRV